jgi:hypothetical protein
MSTSSVVPIAIPMIVSELRTLARTMSRSARRTTYVGRTAAEDFDRGNSVPSCAISLISVGASRDLSDASGRDTDGRAASHWGTELVKTQRRVAAYQGPSRCKRLAPNGVARREPMRTST